MGAYAFVEMKNIKSYARTLYTNYRARMVSAGYSMPEWVNASPVVKREFMQEARQLLS